MSLNYDKSKAAYEAANKVIPGGVNSPVRAFRAVGDYPIFIESGQGAHVTDIDGNELIDFICSWGPLIFGHNDPVVQEAVMSAVQKGTTFGMPTEIETLMAEKIVELIPSIEKVRMVSSGTEATMSALRLARGYTGRDKIVKCGGCYHGHADHLLIQAGSGALTFGVPSSPGVPENIAHETLTATYNDIDSFKALFAEYQNEIAAVIIEPIPGNMGLILPEEGFLEALRELTKENGSLLIFDEVISGFRASLGGAQKRFGIMPDLTCLGKIIGGGLPVGAFGGRADIMDHLAPVGDVYQAGTLSGNPLAMKAGYTTLCELQKRNPYADLDARAKRLEEGLAAAADAHGVRATINQVGSLLTVFFTDRPVHTYADAQTSSVDQYRIFFQALLAEGIHLPPSQFECWFISTAHTDADIEKTIQAAEKAFAAVAKA
ncbi:glutamate-1-semialdehyde 2,1-aminomutase [Peptococcus niger]|uniref:Glutamate-1-semialdehyde 2,1-aminomutase n=1 Tax=Peptococcus niger TaxID=2741 RepID=A0A1G6RIM2_PEPNI|nr:glutamate-1-semialdehyde 2,1-aminomutase [Peptococcus niger]SDD04510.1 glutamate-1-semialdehyde 2,1-aminomutase [Peptococcus niger]